MTSGSSQGLFVIVAVVIFGIFVAISYLLFRDKMQIGLANIFDDSISQSKTDLSGKDGTNNDTDKEDTLLNVSSTREDSDYLYARIREADASKNETEIWVQAKKLSDGTLQLYQSSTSDSNYTYGTSDMTGSLIIPDTINGMKITSIERDSSNGTFESASFTGELRLPSSLTTISEYAFYHSEFTGELKLPSSLKMIEYKAFYLSTFTGELSLPSSLKMIGYKALYFSTFTGTLDVSNVTYIQGMAFYNSKIDEVIVGDVKMSDGSTANNTSGIHPNAIKLAYGNFYNGSNAN